MPSYNFTMKSIKFSFKWTQLTTHSHCLSILYARDQNHENVFRGASVLKRNITERKKYREKWSPLFSFVFIFLFPFFFFVLFCFVFVKSASTWQPTSSNILGKKSQNSCKKQIGFTGNGHIFNQFLANALRY